jgi:RimJ/RimL family protein N-acetyltransferase
MQTERLVLREPGVEHCESLADLWAHPAVTRFVGGLRDRNVMLGYFREFVANPPAYRTRWGEQFWAVLERGGGELLGECTIVEKEINSVLEYELGYFFFPHAWGHGYALEASHRVVRVAFEELCIPSLIAIIHQENARSEATARRLGMTLDRRLLRENGQTKFLFRLSPPEGRGPTSGCS